jgi:AraC family ethanolamine operon transcriptional activator
LSFDAGFKARTAESLGFYDYARSVCEPGVTLMLVKPSRSSWQVARCLPGRIIVQSGAAGSATIADGVSQSGSFVFFLRNSGHADLISLNGEAVAVNDIAVFPPGKSFVFACRGPYEWISFSVPREVLEEAGFSPAQIHTLETIASVIHVPHWAALRLVTAAIYAIEVLQSARISADAGRFSDLERTLLADLSAVVIRNCDPVAISSSQTRSPNSFVQDALAFIRAHEGEELHVEHLCRATDLAERSLLRAFHKLFGVGTTQYLKLRRLNRVHFALMAPGATTVAGVLAVYGIREFGRFAGAYKTLFGESPSETLKKAGASKRPSY